MNVQDIDATQAKRLLSSGDAVLIDIREPDEHARERIPGAQSVPLSALPRSIHLPQKQAIFHCRSGGRTAAAAERLAGASSADTYLLTGGLEAWKKAGYPVERDRARPIEMMRQVQIAAGSLVLGGVILGATVDSKFYRLSGFVGAGLLFAGLTGTCGMARLLAFAPWNRF